MESQKSYDKLIEDSTATPPMGSFKAWYILLLAVLIAEIIFFIWVTQYFS
ncbi:MAG: hypothetical protein WCH59_09840 [Chitinophagia bacterium]|jgi:hypothetical protein